MVITMDSEKIIQELNQKFAAPLPEFYKRRIVFWYDEDREFEEQINEIQLSNAKIVCLTGNNNFELKKLLPPDYQLKFCHQMVYHGRAVCNARNPKCTECALLEVCKNPVNK